MLCEYDVVELTKKISDDLDVGTQGVIVMDYASDPPEYEVEFFTDEGDTLAVRTTAGSQLRKVSGN